MFYQTKTKLCKQYQKTFSTMETTFDSAVTIPLYDCKTLDLWERPQTNKRNKNGVLFIEIQHKCFIWEHIIFGCYSFLFIDDQSCLACFTFVICDLFHCFDVVESESSTGEAQRIDQLFSTKLMKYECVLFISHGYFSIILNNTLKHLLNAFWWKLNLYCGTISSGI